MPTERNPDQFGFARGEGRAVVASFDGGTTTSDAGGLLPGAADRAIRLVDRFAACLRDRRSAGLIEHEVRTLVGQRVFGLALGYEDLNDHDTLRHDLPRRLRRGLRRRHVDAEPAGAEPGRAVALP